MQFDIINLPFLLGRIVLGKLVYFQWDSKHHVLLLLNIIIIINKVSIPLQKMIYLSSVTQLRKQCSMKRGLSYRIDWYSIETTPLVHWFSDNHQAVVCTFLGYGKKPGHLVESHAVIGRTCIQHWRWGQNPGC